MFRGAVSWIEGIMHVVSVSDPTAPELGDYRDLTDVALRRISEPAGGLYLAESAKVIARALAAGHHPRSVLLQRKWLDDIAPLLEPYDVPVYLGESGVLEQVTGFVMHRGAIAAMHRPALPTVESLLSEARRVVVLEDVVDHTNVGAVFRAVAGLGADAVLITPRCADPLYRRSVRVSMGAVLQVPWSRLETWPTGADQLRSAGFTLAALALDDRAIDLTEFANHPPHRVALVLGSEGTGLSAAALSAADVLVTIPMDHGVDSLNVASSAAIALWSLRRTEV
jgi:tRNA G18 (ribose-2'-O)-methylase SpoU